MGGNSRRGTSSIQSCPTVGNKMKKIALAVTFMVVIQSSFPMDTLCLDHVYIDLTNNLSFRFQASVESHFYVLDELSSEFLYFSSVEGDTLNVLVVTQQYSSFHANEQVRFPLVIRRLNDGDYVTVVVNIDTLHELAENSSVSNIAIIVSLSTFTNESATKYQLQLPGNNDFTYGAIRSDPILVSFQNGQWILRESSQENAEAES